MRIDPQLNIPIMGVAEVVETPSLPTSRAISVKELQALWRAQRRGMVISALGSIALTALGTFSFLLGYVYSYIN